MRTDLATLLPNLRRRGRDVAIIRYTGNRRKAISYEDLASLAGRFAALLVCRGVGKGDRLLLWAENSAEWVAAFYGCMLRGVVVVPLDANGTTEFALKVAADVSPSLVVGDSMLLRRLQHGWPTLSLEDWPNALPDEESGPVAELSPETHLQILFTSGTTGEPKGIVHTHGNVLASVEPIEEAAGRYLRYERLGHPLRLLHTLPLSHVFGQTMGLWIPPVFGAEVHFESRLDPRRLIETIARERISVLVGVPRVLALLKSYLEAEYPTLKERLAASGGISAAKRWWRFRDIHARLGLKFWALVTGGGALPAPVEQFWNTLGFVLVQGYGMTETAALITLNHPFHVARGTLGKPLPGREVRLGADGEVFVRGAMISRSTWSGGAFQERMDEWLATGDLAAAQPTGELRFLGRKSEVIVTSAGANVHPEDLEAILEEDPNVTGCAVIRIDTASGPEPCAVLATLGGSVDAGAIVAKANAALASSQRIRRWLVWPEPDLPRTSTGKVRRAAVSTWAIQQGEENKENRPVAGGDWLLNLIAQITGENPRENRDGLLLEEDLHLDSLGRMQLMAALGQREAIPMGEVESDQIRTIGELRQWMRHEESSAASFPVPDNNGDPMFASTSETDNASVEKGPAFRSAPHQAGEPLTPAAARYIYPYWPWQLPFRCIRVIFLECVVRPLVWILAKPRVSQTRALVAHKPVNEPALIVANHVSAYDLPLLLYALPRSLRRRTAVAMSGEMLEDFRHARDSEIPWLQPFGPLVWLLLTGLFNVFPLPRRRGFQRSFSHIGEVLDHGFHVIIFPEGTRSSDGQLGCFRKGIGLLVKESSAPVLPVALVGLGEMKMRRRSWFRSGSLDVRVGQPMTFAPTASQDSITEALREAVERLLSDADQVGSFASEPNQDAS